MKKRRLSRKAVRKQSPQQELVALLRSWRLVLVAVLLGPLVRALAAVKNAPLVAMVVVGHLKAQ